MTNRDEIVTIFGSSRPQRSSSDYALAEQLGHALACAGYTICNGGTMEAAARGARRGGGSVIGVTCSVFGNSVANEFVDNEIQTDSLLQRLQKLIDLAHAYVVLPGGTGTLVELATVWELRNKKMLPVRPLIVLGDFWLPVVDVACKDKPSSRDVISVARDVRQVCELLER